MALCGQIFLPVLFLLDFFHPILFYQHFSLAEHFFVKAISNGTFQLDVSCGQLAMS